MVPVIFHKIIDSHAYNLDGWIWSAILNENYFTEIWIVKHETNYLFTTQFTSLYGLHTLSRRGLGLTSSVGPTEVCSALSEAKNYSICCWGAKIILIFLANLEAQMSFKRYS